MIARRLRLVVAGGIGTGKSLLGRLLAERGFAVLDADRVGHRILAADHPVAVLVAERWPETATGGEIDRRALGRIVFNDRSQLAELEAITHPAIREGIARWAAEVGRGPAAVELPVLADLVGEGWSWLIVDAPSDLRRRRLRERGMSVRDIEARLASQPSRSEWLAAADFVIGNAGTPERLGLELDRTLERIGLG